MPRVPHLRFQGSVGSAESVVLILPGGAPDGLDPVPPFDHAMLRMIPFSRSVFRAGGGRIAVATLRYSVRGWNGQRESPLADARWALGQISERFGDLPIGLVGHSMGGRVALRMADYRGPGREDDGGDHRRVRSIAALAPWVPNGEPIPSLGDGSLLLAHGTSDRVTDPAKTAALAERLIADGRDVEFKKVEGARHAMLFPARPWHDMVSRFMVQTLLAPAMDGPARPSRQ